MYRRRDNEKKKYFQIPIACRRHGADNDIRRRAPERFVGIRLPMLSLKAEAAITGTTEDGLFEYELDLKGAYYGMRITRYKGPDSGEVVIPKTIGGYEVKWIGGEWEDKAFQGCTGITSIVIPDSVISIDRSAFFGCTSLAEITVSPDNKNYSALTVCCLTRTEAS